MMYYEDDKIDTFSPAVKPTQEIIDYVEEYRVQSYKLLNNKFSVWSPVSFRTRLSDGGIDYAIKIWTGSSRFPEYAVIQVNIFKDVRTLVLAFETNKRFTYTMAPELFTPTWDLIDAAYIFRRRAEYIIGKKYMDWNVLFYQQRLLDYIIHVQADEVFVKIFIKIGAENDPVFLDAEEYKVGNAPRKYVPLGIRVFEQGKGMPDEIQKVVLDAKDQIEKVYGQFVKFKQHNSIIPIARFDPVSFEFQKCSNLISMNYKIRVAIGADEIICVYMHDTNVVSVVDETASDVRRLPNEYVRSLIVKCGKQLTEHFGGTIEAFAALDYVRLECNVSLVEYTVRIEYAGGDVGRVKIQVTNEVPYVTQFLRNMH